MEIDYRAHTSPISVHQCSSVVKKLLILRFSPIETPILLPFVLRVLCGKESSIQSSLGSSDLALPRYLKERWGTVRKLHAASNGRESNLLHPVNPIEKYLSLARLRLKAPSSQRNPSSHPSRLGAFVREPLLLQSGRSCPIIKSG